MHNVFTYDKHMKKTLLEVQVHSSVDVITNSSSEIFCRISGNQEEIEKIIDKVMKEFGCEAVELTVNELYDNYDELIPGKYVIEYDFETHQCPCKLMEKRLKELFKQYKEKNNTKKTHENKNSSTK